jgi:hypothetical protein
VGKIRIHGANGRYGMGQLLPAGVEDLVLILRRPSSMYFFLARNVQIV